MLNQVLNSGWWSSHTFRNCGKVAFMRLWAFPPEVRIFQAFRDVVTNLSYTLPTVCFFLYTTKRYFLF